MHGKGKVRRPRPEGAVGPCHDERRCGCGSDTAPLPNRCVDIRSALPQGTGRLSAVRAGIRDALSVGYVRFGYIRYICLSRIAVRPRTGLPSDGRFRFFIE